jgi:hypothetical protein
MGPGHLENGSVQGGDLGAARTAFRASRKTLFWSHLLALSVCAAGTAVLVGLLRLLLTDWSQDVLGSIVLLAVGLLLLWAGRSLWRHASRVRRLHIVVHDDGIAFHNGITPLVCRWDEIVAAHGRSAVHYDAAMLSAGGIPVPGTTHHYFSHVSHQYTLWRKDGEPLVFTEEIRNVVELARIVEHELARRAAPEQLQGQPGADAMGPPTCDAR